MATPITITVTPRDKDAKPIATVVAKPVTVGGITMGLHKDVVRGPRGGLITLSSWIITEPVTGCSVGRLAFPHREPTDAINAARKQVRDKGGPAKVQARIAFWLQRFGDKAAA